MLIHLFIEMCSIKEGANCTEHHVDQTLCNLLLYPVLEPVPRRRFRTGVDLRLNGGEVGVDSIQGAGEEAVQSFSNSTARTLWLNSHSVHEHIVTPDYSARSTLIQPLFGL